VVAPVEFFDRFFDVFAAGAGFAFRA